MARVGNMAIILKPFGDINIKLQHLLLGTL